MWKSKKSKYSPNVVLWAARLRVIENHQRKVRALESIRSTFTKANLRQRYQDMYDLRDSELAKVAIKYGDTHVD